MEHEIVICQCENAEHQIIFSYIENNVYMQVHLNPERNILRRIWMALLYILGYRSEFGHFDEIVLKKKDASKFHKIAEYLEDAKL
jgi:hypothetical protein